MNPVRDFWDLGSNFGGGSLRLWEDAQMFFLAANEVDHKLWSPCRQLNRALSDGIRDSLK